MKANEHNTLSAASSMPGTTLVKINPGIKVITKPQNNILVRSALLLFLVK
jgi:hypothetical protein